MSKRSKRQFLSANIKRAYSAGTWLSRHDDGRHFQLMRSSANLPKLRPKSAVGRAMLPSLRVSDVKYGAPLDGQSGFISFRFDGETIANRIKLMPDKDIAEKVGRWANNADVVFASDHVPHKYLKSLAVHESIEKYLKECYGLDENAEGHDIAEAVEKKLFLKSRPIEEWKDYGKHVKFVSQLSGGKTRPVSMAYSLLRRKKLEVPKFEKQIRMLPVAKLTFREAEPIDLERRTRQFIGMIRRGEPFGPIVAYKDSRGSWKVHDGCARTSAYRALGIEKIPATVMVD